MQQGITLIKTLVIVVVSGSLWLQACWVHRHFANTTVIRWVSFRLKAGAVQALLLVLSATLVAVIASAVVLPTSRAARATCAVILVQLAIGVLWYAPLLHIMRVAGRRRWRPLALVCAGACAHLASIVIGVKARCSPSANVLREAGLNVAGFVLTLTVVAGTVLVLRTWRRTSTFTLRLPWVPIGQPSTVLTNHGAALRGFTVVSLVSGILILASVPLSDTLCFDTSADQAVLFSQILRKTMRVCSPGMLLSLDLAVLWPVVTLAGWLSAAFMARLECCADLSWKRALLAGGWRVRVELVRGLAVLAPCVAYATGGVEELVRWQNRYGWGIVVQPIAGAIFLFGSVLVQQRIHSVTESMEANARHLEASSRTRGVIALVGVEKLEIVVSSLLFCTLFLGGWSIPFVYRGGMRVEFAGHYLVRQAIPETVVVILGTIAFTAKGATVCWLQSRIRVLLQTTNSTYFAQLTSRWLLCAGVVNVAMTALAALGVASSGFLARALTVFGQFGMLAVALISASGLLYAAWAAAERAANYLASADDDPAS